MSKWYIFMFMSCKDFIFLQIKDNEAIEVSIIHYYIHTYILLINEKSCRHFFH